MGGIDEDGLKWIEGIAFLNEGCGFHVLEFV